MSTHASKQQCYFAAAMLIPWIPLFVGTPAVRAADTVETWDAGATDVEFYSGVDGVGRPGPERTILSNMLLGYGLSNRFSAYLGVKLQGNGVLEGGQSGVNLGVFGTLVDHAHFDLDLFFDVGVGGGAPGEFKLAPAVEVNLDLDSQRRSAGAYLRLGMPVHGQSGAFDTSAAAEHTPAVSLVLNPGVYLTIPGDQQVLLEYDMSIHRWSADEHPVDIGGLALGYNVKLSDSIEMISQVYLDLPQRDETLGAGVMAGFIATLPAARSTR